MEEKFRKRMIQAFRFPEEDMSLRNWSKVKGVWTVMRNYLLISICKFLPDIEFKNVLYRRIGIKIGKDVTIMGSSFDIFFPELIRIDDGTTIGAFTVVLTHEFHNGGWSRGGVRIGKNCLIGAMTVILPGVEIGDNCTVAAYSLVNKSIPPGTFVGGVPAKVIGKVTRE